ncbi:Transposase domain [Oceanicella actignis]|nr:Transposase domain [Oceanicella actignis]
MAHSPGFFDLDERYAALSATGDPLERLSSAVDFEMFRPALDAALKRWDRPKGGRPPMDAVFGPSLGPMAFGASLFKVLVVQSLYGLADERTEFQIRDRLSFMLMSDNQVGRERQPRWPVAPGGGRA